MVNRKRKAKLVIREIKYGVKLLWYIVNKLANVLLITLSERAVKRKDIENENMIQMQLKIK